MNFFEELESGDSFILESQGSAALGIDANGYAVAHIQGDSNSYFIRDVNGEKLK